VSRAIAARWRITFTIKNGSTTEMESQVRESLLASLRDMLQRRCGKDRRKSILNPARSIPRRPLSEAVRVGDTLYLSGQIGIQPGTLKLVRGWPQGRNLAGAEQHQDDRWKPTASRCAMSSSARSCSRTSPSGAISTKSTRAHFSAPYPARSALGANGLALGAQVEVECIAQKNAGGKEP
jgi:enamine deaminase RidA (YjgF/YER057c/UK114 family)